MNDVTDCLQTAWENESAELHGFGYALPCLDLAMPTVVLQKFGKTFQERLQAFDHACKTAENLYSCMAAFAKDF